MDFFEHLTTFMDDKEAKNLYNSLNSQETHAFRLNTLKVDHIESIFEEGRGLTKLSHLFNAYRYDKELYDLGKNILFYAGAYYIQEPAAMMAESLLNIKENDIVLDMCAAPGGKSFNALVDMKDKGLLICNDINESRSKILSSNIEKYGFQNCIVLNDDSKHYKSQFIHFFNKIILDAPCSGSAMFRKNEDARKLWSMDKVYQCQKIQKSLIEDAYEMLQEGGYLLYSTCSFSPQENEYVIIDFLKQHQDMEIIPISLNKLYNDTIQISGGLRLYPHKFNGEGQVMFLLKKKDITEAIINRSSKKEFASCRTPRELNDFLNDLQLEYSKNDIVFFKNHFWLVNFEKINIEKLKVNRYGLDLGEVQKGRFIPSHSLAMYHGLSKKNFIELSYENAIQYLRGLTIPMTGNSGFKIVSYKGLALGWVKHANNTLKNHYPKGLRIKF